VVIATVPVHAARVIAGEFPVVGTQPDGDSARFYPDDPDAWCKTRIRARVNPSGGVQLRLDAIDAVETHYTPPKGARRLHQPGEAGPVLAVVVDLDGVLRRWDPGVLAGAEAAFGLPAGALGGSRSRRRCCRRR